MPGFLGDYNTNSAVPEVYCCQEPPTREEPVYSLEQFPASPEYAATLNQPRAKKKRRQVSHLMFFSSVLIATVATLSIGYLNVSSALTYVTENAAGVFVSALRVTNEADAVPLTYELVERDTHNIVETGLVTPGDAVMSFGNLASSTGYALRIYNGQELVKQFPFSTITGKGPTMAATPTPTPAPTLAGQTTAKPTTPTPPPAPMPAPTFLTADGSVLTAAEAANAGTHTYYATGEIYGPSGGRLEPATESLTFVFKTVGGNLMMGDGETFTYTRVAENLYESSINGVKLTAVFTVAGLKIHAEGAYDLVFTLMP